LFIRKRTLALQGETGREDVSSGTRDHDHYHQGDKAASCLPCVLPLLDFRRQEVDPRFSADDQPGCILGAHALLPNARPRATVMPPRLPDPGFSAVRSTLTPPK